MTSISEKVKLQWPTADPKDVITVTPLGSRVADSDLIYWRKRDLIMTGWISGHACFLGSLDDLAASVEKKYTLTGSFDSPEGQRWGAEYRAAVAFLRALPPLADQGSTESGLTPADLGEPVGEGNDSGNEG